MRKTTKQILRIAIFGLAMIIMVSFIGHICIQRLDGEIEPFEKRDISNTHFVMEGDSCYYLFDTGYSTSAFYVDNPARMVGNLFPSMIIFSSSVTGQIHINVQYYSDSLNLDFIRSRRTVFRHFSTGINFFNKILPKGYLPKPWFVIGMNLIRQANWLFDMKKHQIHCLSKGKKQGDFPEIPSEPALILPYRLDYNNTPKTDLNIDGSIVRNVIIDMGCGMSLCILKKDTALLRLTQKELSSDSITTSIGSVRNRIYSYSKPSVNLNGMFNWESAQFYISEKDMPRLLGKEFFKRFDYVFLDTNKQEFRFFRKKSD